jgi:hypothetical protein
MRPARLADATRASASRNEAAETSFEKPAADASVLFCGHGDTGGVDTLGKQGFFASNYLRTKLRCNLGCTTGIRIDNSDELRAGEIAPDAYVIAAEFAHTDDRDADGFLAHDFFLISNL